jgi:hypothetical protein
MSSEILVERGIGETRAAIVEDGDIAELHIERDAPLRAGDVWNGRLTRILVPGRRGVVDLGGAEALIEPLPRVAEGALVNVEVVRESIPEPGRPRLPKVQATGEAAGTEGRASAGPPLIERLRARRAPLREIATHGPDALEAAGWSEAIEEARTGVVAFDGGLLTISLTPAMTVIDVDGALPPAELAVRGARAAAQAIRRHGIAGSIGIDLPTVGDKAVRQAAAAAVDAELPQPFERTAVNGFGFLQIVRRRVRPSTLELVQGAPVDTQSLVLLRRAEREPAAGVRLLVAAPAVIGWIEARSHLLAELERRSGRPVRLQEDASRSISAGYVDVRPL